MDMTDERSIYYNSRIYNHNFKHIISQLMENTNPSCDPEKRFMIRRIKVNVLGKNVGITIFILVMVLHQLYRNFYTIFSSITNISKTKMSIFCAVAGLILMAVVLSIVSLTVQQIMNYKQLKQSDFVSLNCNCINIQKYELLHKNVYCCCLIMPNDELVHVYFNEKPLILNKHKNFRNYNLIRTMNTIPEARLVYSEKYDYCGLVLV